MIRRFALLLPPLVLVAACAATPPARPTPAARLHADLTAMEAFPQARISQACNDKVQSLITVIHQITAMKQAGKAIDPVSQDVLASSQTEAVSACHPDAVRVCQAPTNPAQAKACADVSG